MTSVTSNTTIIGEGLRRQFSVSDTGLERRGDFDIIKGRMTKGFGIASGRTPNAYSDIGCVPAQYREAKKTRPDYYEFLKPFPAEFGTINMKADIWLWPIAYARYEEKFAWCDKLTESFGFVVGGLKHINSRQNTEIDYEARWYWPDPRSKGSESGESHDYEAIELQCKLRIPDLQQGDRLEFAVPHGSVIVLPAGMKMTGPRP